MKTHFDLTGYVGMYDFSPSYMRYMMNEKKDDTLCVGITSPGGSYLAALELVDIIRKSKRKISCYIGAYAMSAASWVSLACGEISVASNAILMYHKPMFMPSEEPSNADEMRKVADILDVAYNGYRELMAARTGKSNEEIDELLKDELWCTPEEALQLKLVDKVIPVARSNKEVTNYKLPDRLVAYIRGKNEEIDKMAIKDILAKFSISAADGAEEAALVAHVETLQKRPETRQPMKLGSGIVAMFKRNREMELDELARQGKATPAVVNTLKERYATEKHISESVNHEGEIVDSFDDIVATLRKNDEVINFGGQTTRQTKQEESVNPLIADMESRLKGGK